MSGGLNENLVANLLRTIPGRAYCHTCLAQILEMKVDDAIAITKRLRVEEGFAMSTRECANCDQQRAVFGFTPSA